jgi:hypothetical protein
MNKHKEYLQNQINKCKTILNKNISFFFRCELIKHIDNLNYELNFNNNIVYKNDVKTNHNQMESLTFQQLKKINVRAKK